MKKTLTAVGAILCILAVFALVFIVFFRWDKERVSEYIRNSVDIYIPKDKADDYYFYNSFTDSFCGWYFELDGTETELIKKDIEDNAAWVKASTIDDAVHYMLADTDFAKADISETDYSNSYCCIYTPITQGYYDGSKKELYYGNAISVSVDGTDIYKSTETLRELCFNGYLFLFDMTNNKYYCIEINW